MSRKFFEDMNSELFLREAFDVACQEKMIQAARLRRNVYLALFIVGFFCILTAALMGMHMLSVLSLFLATLSLVIMSKYDTQVYFLTLIAKKKRAEEA
jgi:uncharacterized membrane protein YjjP (DUF1212 family)